MTIILGIAVIIGVFWYLIAKYGVPSDEKLKHIQPSDVAHFSTEQETLLWCNGMERQFNKDGMLDTVCKKEMKRYRATTNPYERKRILSDCIIEAIKTVGPHTKDGTNYNAIDLFAYNRDHSYLMWYDAAWPELTKEDWLEAKRYKSSTVNDQSFGEGVVNVVVGGILCWIIMGFLFGFVGFFL